jgi:SAM-dependent methyltransferase
VKKPWGGLFPEIAAGGYTRLDKSVDFYGRINALVTPESVVVDFGAGRGGFMDEPDSYARRLRLLKGRVRKVIGVDVDPVVMENSSVDVAMVWQPGAALDIPDESVDVVLSDFTFEHIDDPIPVKNELERILKPGGWICARTPNRWGYIALGARLIPNRWHAHALRRLQPHREERDIFPTRYRLNSLRAVREFFPTPGWEVYGYTVAGEPSYFGSSRLLIYSVYGLSKILPQRLGPIYLFFIRKAPPLTPSAT